MDNDIEQVPRTPEETYAAIRTSIVSAQKRMCSAVNSAMVLAYHEIGQQVFRACGENDRTGYGLNLLQYLEERLTKEFGKGYSVRNLQMMRKFYLAFPNANTLCSELSWSHYRLLMRIPDKEARDFYTMECAKAAWSVRQLERQIRRCM